MSFAETYSAATASIMVSPWTTGTSCIGPHVVGVIAPENVPVPVALAAPVKKTSSAAARMAPIASPGRIFNLEPPRVWEKLRGRIYPGIDRAQTAITYGFLCEN